MKSKAWTYHRKQRKRGRWAYRPIDPRVVAAYVRGAWDAIVARPRAGLLAMLRRP